MGSMTAEFSNILFPNGVPFHRVQEMINSLEGITYITNMYTGVDPVSSLSFHVICFTNDNFADGTKVVPKYKRLANYLGLTTVFDGVDIIDPLLSVSATNTPPPGGVPVGTANSTTTNNVPLTGTYHYTATISNSAIPPNTVLSPGAIVKVSVHPYANIQDEEDPFNPQCDCGAAAVSGGHSSWCSVSQAANLVHGDHNG